MALFLKQKKTRCGSWLASAITGSAQVLEKYQMERPGSLRSWPWASSRALQPSQHPSGDTGGELIPHSPSGSEVTSSRRCDGCIVNNQHVKITSPNVLPQECQMSTALTPGLQHPGTAHPCLPTSSLPLARKAPQEVESGSCATAVLTLHSLAGGMNSE